MSDFEYIGRKEILVLAFFTGALYKGRGKYALLVYSVILLIHESVIFLLPFFLYFEITINQRNFANVVVIYALVTMFYLFLIYSFGLHLAAIDTKSILEKRGFLNYGGPFTWNVNAAEFIISNFKKYLWSLVTIGIAYIIMLNTTSFLEPHSKKEIILLLLTATVSIIPLFYLAVDWGRWIHIFFMLFMLFVFNILRYNSLKRPLHFKDYLIVAVAITLGLFYKNGIMTPSVDSYWTRLYHLILG